MITWHGNLLIYRTIRITRRADIVRQFLVVNRSGCENIVVFWIFLSITLLPLAQWSVGCLGALLYISDAIEEVLNTLLLLYRKRLMTSMLSNTFKVENNIQWLVDISRTRFATLFPFILASLC